MLEAYDRSSRGLPHFLAPQRRRSSRVSAARRRGALFRLSFDPHHCVERRWGAEGAELAPAAATAPLKRAWYEAEQRNPCATRSTAPMTRAWISALRELRGPDQPACPRHQ